MKNSAVPESGARRLSPAAILTIAAFSASLLLSAAACAPGGFRRTVVVNYYPQCFSPITILHEESKELASKVAQGAVGGAFVGALGGFLSGGSTQDIQVGAALGAIEGATVSYIITSEVQAQDQAERFATYAQYIDDDYATLNKAVVSARAAAGCYKQAYDQLSRDYQAGRMDEAEYR